MTNVGQLPPKVDPETLVLRASPRPVMRFKRPVLIGAAAVGCLAIFGITWMGLGTPVPKAAETNELYNPDTASDQTKPKSEALDALPKTYAEVPANTPVLGPPLPGDLGGPALAQQQAGGYPPPASHSAPPSAQPNGSASGVFFQIAATASSQTPSRSSAEGTEVFQVPVAPTAIPSADSYPPLNASVTPRTGSIYNSHMLETPASPYQVMAGTVINASLITGLKSDLAGMVIAQVTAPVFDSVTGKILLVPQGTKLLGEYQTDLGFGQSRVLLVWKRLILPDGSSLEIDNFPATDTRGYAGLTDRVDVHTWSLLKGVGLSTLLGLTAYDGSSDDSDLVRAFRDATWQTANQAGQELVRRAIDIKPTVTVRPGWPVRVIVQKDLILRPYEGRANPWQN